MPSYVMMSTTTQLCYYAPTTDYTLAYCYYGMPITVQLLLLRVLLHLMQNMYSSIVWQCAVALYWCRATVQGDVAEQYGGSCESCFITYSALAHHIFIHINVQ